MPEDFIDEMIRNSPKWELREVDEGKAAAMANLTGYSEHVCRILLLRGIESGESLDRFFNDDLFALENPFLFNQMHTAVARVRRALHDGERIFIFGDRDVDGVLSTAMLANMLRRFDADVLYRVPEGEYGYGIEKRDIQYAKDQGSGLIITVDTGVSSAEEIAYASSLGVDTVVIDHHVQPSVLPKALAVLNPKMELERYPFKHLSAGGVVLKFIHAFILSHTKNFNRVFVLLFPDGEAVRAAKIRNGLVEETLQFEESVSYPIEKTDLVVRDNDRPVPAYITEWLKENKIDQISLVGIGSSLTLDEFARSFIRLFWKRQRKSMEFVRSFVDLSAISTIADIMPLVGENRIIVKEGLKQIPGTSNTGLSVLIGYCDLPPGELTSRDVAWSISPLINSAGRMGDAHLAVRLFVTEDAAEASELSKLLVELNTRRKEKGEKNFNIIMPIVEDKYYKDPIIVLDTDKAEHGVTGIIAGKIARRFARPVFIIVNDGSIGVGSGRGGKDFDLVSLVARCGDLLEKYGGHESAVGFSIDAANIESFRRRIQEIAQSEYAHFKCAETLEIDGVLEPESVNFALVDELRILEPTGAGNPIPQFMIRGVQAIGPAHIGKDKNHLKFHIPSRDGLIPVVGWGLADKGFRILETSPLVDIVVSIEDNYFRGERSVQLVLQDMRAAGR